MHGSGRAAAKKRAVRKELTRLTRLSGAAEKVDCNVFELSKIKAKELLHAEHIVRYFTPFSASRDEDQKKVMEDNGFFQDSTLKTALVVGLDLEWSGMLDPHPFRTPYHHSLLTLCWTPPWTLENVI